jgi:glutamine cyclotransferase
MDAAPKQLLVLLLFLLTPYCLSTPVYNYQIIASYPHNTDHFTQGLAIKDSVIYESTGRYGKSRLLKYALTDGQIEHELKLSRHYFGEGLTLVNDQIIQLTWKSKKAFIYNQSNLKRIGAFRLKGEGWGLTSDGDQLIYSDGSSQLHFISAIDGHHLKSLQVTENGRPLKKLNELEWVEGTIYANIWQSNFIVMISPSSGEVIGRIDLSMLLPRAMRNWNTGVLNGIAYEENEKKLIVTGKQWPSLYQIRLLNPRKQLVSGKLQNNQ